jgi:DNA-binding transcriptional regulator YiaG
MTASEIRFLREEMKCTQRKFAALMGVTPRTVSAWEKGVPPSPMAAKLLRVAAGIFDISHRTKPKK